MIDRRLEAFRVWVAAALRGEIRADPGVPFALLKEHHLAPLAYVAGDARCRDEYAASAALAAQRGILLRELSGAIGGTRLRAALIKGAAYASRIYDDPAERLMLDVDLLVPASDFPGVVELLEARGFRPVDRPRGRSGWHHALTIQRRGAMLDVHRSMLQPLRAALPLDALWARAAGCPEWPGLRLLDPVDELLVTLLHLVRQELRVPVAGYLDVERLLLRLGPTGEAKLTARARAAHVGRGVEIALEMLALLRGASAGRPRGGLWGLPLPSTSDVLREALPRRWPRIGWKLAVTESSFAVLGLGVGHVVSWADGQARVILARARARARRAH